MAPSAPRILGGRSRWAVAFGWFAWWSGLIGPAAGLWVVPAAAQSSGTGHRVDGVAAFVGARAPGPDATVILRSDVELRARLLLAGRSPASPAAGALPTGLLEATLQTLIGEALIVREARRIRIGTVRETAVAAERAHLVDMAGGVGRMLSVLKRVGATEGAIGQIARQRAIVAAFLASNLEGVTEVTQAEVDAALVAAGAGDPAEVSVAERRLVAARLSRAALHRGVERWVRVLRARVPVRICSRFSAE